MSRDYINDPGEDMAFSLRRISSSLDDIHSVLVFILERMTVDPKPDVEQLARALRAARPAYIDISNSHNIWLDPDEDPPAFDPDEYDSLAADLRAAL